MCVWLVWPDGVLTQPLSPSGLLGGGRSIDGHGGLNHSFVFR